MPEENRKIELDLDQDQPIEAKKVEGVWGIYEELAKLKDQGGELDSTLSLGIARPEGTYGAQSIAGPVTFTDFDGNSVSPERHLWMDGGSEHPMSAINIPDHLEEVSFGGEIYTKATTNFSELNRLGKHALDNLEVGETAEIRFKPDRIDVASFDHQSYQVSDENGDLSGGIPLLEVTKTESDDQLKGLTDSEVRFASTWQETGINELA